MNAFQRLLANGSVRFGLTVLGLMVLVAALAPFLGTVDPSAMDSNFINKAAGDAGLFALLDGSSVQHTFWLGTDSFGRDLFSRVIYGTRVSLLVGSCTAVLALVLGGGVLMGWGIQTAYGCGIGGAFSALASLSVSAWLFFPALLLGTWLGAQVIKKTM